MVSIFGRNNDSKYQKDRLDENPILASGGLEAMKVAEKPIGMPQILFDEKLDRGMGLTSHTSPSSALRLLSAIDRASYHSSNPSLYHLYPGRLMAYSSLGSVNVCDNMLSKILQLITLLLATVGKLGAVSCRDPVLLPCMDLGLLWPLAFWLQECSTTWSGALR